MALTLTTDDLTGSDYTLNARAAEKFMIITGSWSMPSTYETGGISANLATLGFTEIFFVNFTCPQLPVRYDYTNDTLLMYNASETATSVYTEMASDTDPTTQPYGYFVAMGWRA